MRVSLVCERFCDSRSGFVLCQLQTHAPNREAMEGRRHGPLRIAPTRLPRAGYLNLPSTLARVSAIPSPG